MRLSSTLAMTLCFLPSVVIAQEPDSKKTAPTVGETFVILEAKTKLQKLGLTPDQRFVWVFINYVDAFKDANTIDYSQIDVPGIWAGLKPLSRAENDTVRFRIMVPWYTSWFASGTRKPTANGLNGLMLQQMGESRGFAKSTVYEQLLSRNDGAKEDYVKRWRAFVNQVSADGFSESGIQEDSVGDDIVQAFPVRTVLSKKIFGGDCVVHITPPIEDIKIGATQQKIKRCVEKLQLERKEKITFVINLDASDPDKANAGIEMFRRVCGAQFYKDVLGFERTTMRTLGRSNSIHE